MKKRVGVSSLVNKVDWIFNIDWRSMFVPTESILEIVIRGTIMYIGMYALLRVFRRQAGTVGIADLLVIVVIADAAQNGMAGDSRSITSSASRRISRKSQSTSRSLKPNMNFTK